jgi:CreA protein
MDLDADRWYRRVGRWSADYRPSSKLGSLGHWPVGRDQTNYVRLGLSVSNDWGGRGCLIRIPAMGRSFDSFRPRLMIGAFSEKTSILFKKIRIYRIPDAKRNILVYLAVSSKITTAK